MKIASFKAGSMASYGIVTDAGIIDAGRRLKNFPTLKSLLARGSLDELKKLQGERPDHALSAVELLTELTQHRPYRKQAGGVLGRDAREVP